jgi:hypothetical protein
MQLKYNVPDHLKNELWHKILIYIYILRKYSTVIGCMRLTALSLGG